MEQYTKLNNVMVVRNHLKSGATSKNPIRKGNIFCICFLLLMSGIFSSCATILSGSKQKILVTGNINVPVELLVDGQSYSNVKLPAKVKIKRKHETSKIAAFAPNYKLEKQVLGKTFNHLVWANVTGTLLFPAFMYVDWSTGANKRAMQNKISMEFTRANSEKEVFDAYIDFGTEYYRNDLLDEALFYFQQANEIDSISDVALEKIHATYNRMDYLEEQARLKEERSNKIFAFLEITAGLLNTAADVVGTVQSTQPSSNSYSSGSGGGNCDCTFLQSQYTRCMRNLGQDASIRQKASVDEVTNPTLANATLKSTTGQTMRVYQQELERAQRQAAKCGCTLR